MSSKVVQLKDIIYFDNNATTLICEPAKTAHANWLSCYNASSSSKLALPAKKMIEKASDDILTHCNVSSATHTIVFTSGGTESNCFIIKACVRAYKKKLIEKNSELKPHVLTSAVEHHSIMECLHELESCGEIEVSYLQPTIYGNINPAVVEESIKPNTCLITVMFANNEIPVINYIEEIGKIAHAHRIPLHSDCVQVFGKYPIDLNKHNIDALTASSHKFYGPKGTGLLIINNALIEGYQLTAEIHGSQQHGLRGGTENIAGIASTLAALKHTFINRKKKNLKLLKLREELLNKLSTMFNFGNYATYLDADKPLSEFPSIELVNLGPPVNRKEFILPNTVLLAIAKNKGKPFCNVDLKEYLDSKNCVVSVGSACMTSSDKASHVLTAIGAPPVIKRGVIRISFGDSNTLEEVRKFAHILRACILKQCSDLKELPTINKVNEKPSEKKIK